MSANKFVLAAAVLLACAGLGLGAGNSAAAAADDPAGFTATESGLKYQAIVKGAEGQSPTAASKVKVIYTGMLADGTVFDSSAKHGSAVEFTVGRAYPWWTEALKLMTRGAKFRFMVPPDLAYGQKGDPPRVPPNATVTFEVELVDFEPGPELPAFHPGNPEAQTRTESGLVYEVVRPGKGEPAKDGELVDLNFALWNQEGRLIDSSEIRGAPMRFSVGTQKLKILNEGARLLSAGARFRFEVPASLAFGSKGFGAMIPPDAATVWELELVKFVKAPAFELPSEEALTATGSGLKYRAVKEGSGASPKMGDAVTVDYAGWLKDGTPFDSSFQRGQTATFELGKVIAGWNEGLQLMKEGAAYIFVIPPELGYGQRGAGEKIPPGATLIFYVELIRVD